MKNLLIALLSTYAVVICLLLLVHKQYKKTTLTNTMECEKVFDGRTEINRCKDQNGDTCYVTIHGISCNFKK